MKPIRSMLFIPGIKEKWFPKAAQSGADTIILDLEDSVPAPLKTEARGLVAQGVRDLANQNVRVYVRINRTPYCFDLKDLEAVIQPGLEGIILPKIDGPGDVDIISSIVSELEYQKGMDIGTIKFVATLETAESIYKAYDIAKKERVVALAGISPRSGDVERALGYKWTAEGLERLYIRSHVVLAAKAANILPIGGLWQDVQDLEGLKESVRFNRQLGYMGEMLIHPSHVEITNAAYSISQEQVQYYKGLIESFEAGLKEGRASVIYDGEHIDYAHMKTAQQMLEYANSMNRGR